MVWHEDSNLQELSHHSGTRADAQLGKNAPQMRAHCPATDVEHVRDHLVGMPLGYHAHDLLLSRAELNAAVPRPSHANEKIAGAIYFGID